MDFSCLLDAKELKNIQEIESNVSFFEGSFDFFLHAIEFLTSTQYENHCQILVKLFWGI